MSMQRYLGRGLSHPVLPAAGGTLAYVHGAAKVEQSIWLILETEPGERIMRPAFGCGLRRFLMAPNTVATRALIRREVANALAVWEPRIQVQQLSVEAGDDPALVLITIDYVHVRDGRPGNLVYPFYLE
jgi:uncharacterized protein